MYDLNNKRFRGVSNNSNGEVDGSTLFTYHQESNIIWGSYEGGVIIKGTLIGKFISQNTIEFHYAHLNQQHELLSGYCRSTIEGIASGKLRLHEQWTWTSGKEGRGESIVEEV